MAQPSIPGTAVGIPRMAYGNDGTNWIAVLVDALGHIQADILSTVLPADAATETKQDTMIIALQLIDDLRAALGSVNTDDLQVDVKTSALPTDAATQTTLASALTALQLIDDLRNALGSVNTDDLQVDVKTSALPTDAATQTTLASALTALQLIDDLRNALGSVNTDDLQVDVKTYPGINAYNNIPFGYNDRYAETVSVAGNGGEVFANGTVVPAGEVWVITQVGIFHSDATARSCNAQVLVSAEGYDLAVNLSLAQWVLLEKSGSWVLKEGDRMRGRFVNLDVGDTGYAQFLGYKMKVA